MQCKQIMFTCTTKSYCKAALLWAIYHLYSIWFCWYNTIATINERNHMDLKILSKPVFTSVYSTRDFATEMENRIAMLEQMVDVSSQEIAERQKQLGKKLPLFAYIELSSAGECAIYSPLALGHTMSADDDEIRFLYFDAIEKYLKENPQEFFGYDKYDEMKASKSIPTVLEWDFIKNLQKSDCFSTSVQPSFELWQANKQKAVLDSQIEKSAKKRASKTAKKM